MTKPKRVVLFSLFVLSLSFTVFSTRLTAPAKAAAPGAQTYYTLTFDKPSKDSFIEGAGSMDQNYGAAWRIDFGFDNYTTRALRMLVQFDLPPEISGANITSATLKLWGPWPFSGGFPSGDVLRACRVTHHWVEGTGVRDGVTWNEYNYSDGLTTGANNWAMPGGDYTLADSATLIVPPYSVQDGVVVTTWTYLNWTVTDMVKGWTNGTYPNCGFLIKLDNESGSYRGGGFPSKEYAEEFAHDLSYAPKLEITYAAVTIESCTLTGDRKDNFTPSETVYVTGNAYSPSTTYNFYIVADQENWSDGKAIPQRILGTATTISSNANGDIPPTAVWSNALTVGKYDVVVDVNGNGKYDVGIDALDDSDVEITAGFLIPEFPSFLILPLMIVTLVAVSLRLGLLPTRRRGGMSKMFCLEREGARRRPATA